MNKTWILVADRVRARLFERGSGTDAIVEIASYVNPEGRQPAGTRGDVRPPRSIESFGSARHAIEPHTTPAEKAEERFARRLRDVLEAGRVDHRYDHLVLVAQPRFLGSLRAVMNRQLRQLVAREIEHDETELTSQQISVHLHE